MSATTTTNRRRSASTASETLVVESAVATSATEATTVVADVPIEFGVEANSSFNEAPAAIAVDVEAKPNGLPISLETLYEQFEADMANAGLKVQMIEKIVLGHVVKAPAVLVRDLKMVKSATNLHVVTAPAAASGAFYVLPILEPLKVAD